MKNFLNNFKAILNNHYQKILILTLAFLAGVELLGLIYKEKLSLKQSQTWDYYTLASYLSKDPLYLYDNDTDTEKKVINFFGKYLILDPKLKIANKVLFDKIYNYIFTNRQFGNNKSYLKDKKIILDSQQFHDYRNSCLRSIINSETLKSFSSLELDSETAYIKRGKIRFYLEDYRGAINDFEKAKALNLNNKAQLNQALALAYFELENPKYSGLGYYAKYDLQTRINSQGRFYQQKDYSTTVITFNPNLANAYYLRGYLSSYEISSKFSISPEKRNSKDAINKAIEKGIFKENIFIEMINDFKNAVQNDPFFYIKYPINKIDPCPIFGDEYPSWIQNLTEKIKTNPNDNYLYHQRALIYLESNNNQKAIEDLNIVTQSNSSENSLKALAYYGLWLAHYKQKNYKTALENINQVIKIYPNFADFYVIRGLTYYEFSKLSKDTKDLEKVIEDCNYAIKVHEELLKKVNPQEDRRFLDELPHANAYLIRGLAYYDLGNQTQALSDYLTALPRKFDSMWPALINELLLPSVPSRESEINNRLLRQLRILLGADAEGALGEIRVQKQLKILLEPDEESASGKMDRISQVNILNGSGIKTLGVPPPFPPKLNSIN